MRAGIAVADSSAGLYAATGILVALAEREKSGRGQWVHTSLLEAQIAMCDFQAAVTLVDGRVPEQAGNDHPHSTPMGVMPTADGFINIGVGGEGQWKSLCRALKRPDLADHPDFATQKERFANRPKLRIVLDELFKQASSAEWLERLEAEGVPAGPIYRMDEVFEDPQVRHLGIAVPITHHARGDIRLIGQPVTLNRTPAAVVTPIPEAGEHTDEVLREAGYDQAAIDRLKAEKIV